MLPDYRIVQTQLNLNNLKLFFFKFKIIFKLKKNNFEMNEFAIEFNVFNKLVKLFFFKVAEQLKETLLFHSLEALCCEFFVRGRREEIPST